MKNLKSRSVAALALAASFFATQASAEALFEVTVTNITKGMVFTPIMVASTKGSERIFELGEAPSEALATIAETGNPGPLQDSLDTLDVTNSSFLPFLAPGESVTQYVATSGRYRYLNVASMLIPSNDIFFAVNGIRGPKGDKSITLFSSAYDAGSEANDELCINLPGPGCNGDPGPDSDNGEGFVHISSGITGVGDLDPATLDFNNPVAKIVIRRISDD